MHACFKKVLLLLSIIADPFWSFQWSGLFNNIVNIIYKYFCFGINRARFNVGLVLRGKVGGRCLRWGVANHIATLFVLDLQPVYWLIDCVQTSGYAEILLLVNTLEYT